MRLIDADALVIRLIDEGQEHSSKYGFKLGDKIRFTPSQVGVIAGQMPTVGVATPEGHWSEDRLPSTGGGSYQVWRCSRCMNAFNWRMRYCGHCGARMVDVE